MRICVGHSETKNKISSASRWEADFYADEEQ